MTHNIQTLQRLERLERGSSTSAGKHMKSLLNRLEYLSGRTELNECSPAARNHMLREIAALRWAMKELEPIVAARKAAHDIQVKE